MAAALKSGGPIATSVALLGGSVCESSSSSSSSASRSQHHAVAFLDKSLNSEKQCRSRSVGVWRRSGRSSPGLGRGRAVVVRAAAGEENSFLKNFGAQFFTVGGTKVDDTDAAPSGGTQFFGIGGKKAGQQKGDAPQDSKGGTQLFKLGTKKSSPQATNGSALVVRREKTGLDSLPFGRGRRVDSKTVFVAGATGQIGARILQQLLRAGFNVRGGVPDVYLAQQLAEFATQYGVISRDEVKKVNAVEFDFKNVASIAKAIGNAGRVVVTVGPTEDGPQGEVSRDDALRILEAASVSNTSHFVLVTEPASGKSSDNGPLAGLTALFNRVFSIRASEISESDLIDRIVESGLKYTIVKAGSTDGVDDYGSETGNLVVEAEGAADPSAKVSKIQVATVVAGVLQHTAVSEDKCCEVTSSPYAPSRPVDELLSAIQVDGRRAIFEEDRARRAAQEREQELRAKAEAEAQEAIVEARKAAKLAAQLEAQSKRLAAEEAKAAALAAKAQARAEAAAASVDGLQVKVKELGGNPPKNISGNPLMTISGRLGTLTLEMEDNLRKATASSQKSPKKQQPVAPQPAPASTSAAPKSPGLFGGLFSPQETFYVDDD